MRYSRGWPALGGSTLVLLALSSTEARGQPPGIMQIPEHHEGKVTALSETIIRIQKGDEEGITFTFSAVLVANQIPKVARDRTVSSHETYRPCDVRVGDIVEIVRNRKDGVDICESILILRRPGGRVPQAPGQKHDPENPQWSWHFVANAQQDLEEKGIPLPDCLIPPWKKKAVAPPPREKK